MAKTIIIDIATDGSVKIDTKGFVGAECKEATRAIEKALGTTTADVKKPEFTQQAKVAGRQQAKQ